MPIKDKKEKIFAKIAAEKTLVEGKYDSKKKQGQNSIETINNKKGKVIEFLTDLVSALVGFMVLVNTIVDTLTYYLAKIEKEIKNGLKTELKNIVSCGVNPSLPSFIKSTGSGIAIQVNKIDFLDMFLINPQSSNGQLMYNDTASLLLSSDFNTFLYGVIQNDGTTQTWRNTAGQGLLDIRFDSIGVGVPNNSLIIKANSNYNNKSLTDLNNDFIESLTLFNTHGLLNRIIDSIYGSISISTNKSIKQLKKEAEIDTVVDKIIDAEHNDIIDDSYFTFTNDETESHLRKSEQRKKGVHVLQTSNIINASIPVEMLNSFTTDFTSATTTIAKKNVLSSHLTTMANQTTVNNTNEITSLPDNISIKLNFTQQIFNNLTKAIVGSIISPKVVMIFLINLKIVYGTSAVYADGVDFIKKNKNIFKSMIKQIVVIIIKILLGIVLKNLAKLIAQAIVKRQIERQTFTSIQTAGLVAPNVKFREYKKSLNI